MQTDNHCKLAWYEQIFEGPDFVTSEPALRPYLDSEKKPQWLSNVMAELQRQGMHLSPIKEMAVVAPKRAGKRLGQLCANIYAVENQLRVARKDWQAIKRQKAIIALLKKKKKDASVASALNKIKVSILLVGEVAKHKKDIQGKVHHAFKAALGQTNYDEALEFFLGFAKGFSKPGLKAGKLTLATDATPIYYEMFYNWQEVDRLGTVTELYDWLLKRGFTTETLGDIDRLRTLCKRIKYAPGKRGRPRNIKK